MKTLKTLLPILKEPSMADQGSLYLVIDAGTTMVKAALLREGDLGLEELASRRLQTIMPQKGWCEMDMEAVWQAVVEVLNDLRAKPEAGWSRIAGVGICAQGEGLWPLDEKKQPARQAILWNDTRAHGPADLEAINQLGQKLSCSPLSAGTPPLILHWLKENEPDIFGRIRHALHCKDWLNFKLTGQIVTDQTDASTSLLNIFTKQYEFDILEALGLARCAQLFPEPLPSANVMGQISKEAGNLLGLAPGTPVIAGALDVVAVATGCGITRPGLKGSAIGTTLTNFVALSEGQAKSLACLEGSLLCHTLPGAYIRQMAPLSGASTLDWVKNTILGGESYESITKAIESLAPGSDGIIYLPYIYGERAPFRQPEASGVFFGLRAHHHRHHLARAAFEGLALSLKDCYLNLPSGETGITVAGGAAANELLCQLLADCLGQAVRRLHRREPGLSGVAALLRLSLTGAIFDDSSTCDEFRPDSGHQKIYDECYKKFRTLKETLLPLWSQK